MPRRNLGTLILIFLVGSSLLVLVLAGPGGPAAGRGPEVGVIRLEGAITAGGSAQDFFTSVSGSDRILSLLQEARRDPSIRAVVLRINSPGGSAAGAQEIAREVSRLREAGKPVVAAIADVGASGAYWVACLTDLVVVNPGSLTGSIGVYIETATLQELYRMLGMEFEIFKSGPHKDMGSTRRPPTDEERAIFQGMVDDIYEQFVDVVAEGRGLQRERVLELADGRVFTGRQAVALGLADRTGNFPQAVEEAAALAGLRAYRVRELGRRRPLERLLGAVETLAGSLHTLARSVQSLIPGVGP
ncbi:MAG: signal peptide peptidase SppA [bacterium]|nr:signal peptide peptidase SppA [bacterium]